MEDLNCWESKFQPCEYSDKLLNLITELNKTARMPVNILEIKKACYVAREYHGSQLRKSGDPYYSHPLEVAYLFAKYVLENAEQYYTTDLIIIAILHDCLENTTLTYEMILIIFNKIIAEGVKDLSRIIIGDSKTTAGDTLLSLYPQNKHGLLYVKIFDRLHNTRTLGAKSLDKRWKLYVKIQYFLYHYPRS
jgi:(p)ppGpp synthase/HD superfamily hydrolase